ncbi:coiled-coil domain containing 120 [Silurus asotus]|uniref:Coiled-coil domain containing 120 n=1 Tax=Silurus asotus TaxID=30991 RepID=A0AAD5AX64_SILAS|nr:coiled-coil domain containing 120 [Silurus asotus]
MVIFIYRLPAFSKPRRVIHLLHDLLRYGTLGFPVRELQDLTSLPMIGIITCSSDMAKFQGCQNSKLQAERISDLQEKKRGLQTLLSSREKELREVCLLEAQHLSITVRSGLSNDVALKQWDGSQEVARIVPLASMESFSSERTNYTYNSLARRSNSSEALLDRSSHSQLVAPQNCMPQKTGPYKSSESLTDGKLRCMYRGSPQRQMGGSKEQSYMHSSVNKGNGASYDEALIDCMSKSQKRPVKPQEHFSVKQIWSDLSALPKSGTSTHCNVFAHSQMHLASATPSYSPIFVKNYQPKPRQVKVTRTKSCGPFTPLQQHSLDHLLVYAYEPTNLLSGSTASSFPNLLPHQTEMPNSTVNFSSKPGPFSLPALDDSTRSLHKALALEGLRDWYLRNALGYPTAASGQDGLRLRPPPHLVHLPWSAPLGPLYSHPQIPQSSSFHGHSLHGRSVELSLYPEQFTSKETAQKGPSSDPPAPGTLV